MNLATVILAAGLGTRMKSAQAKVLHRVAGRPMIEFTVALAQRAKASRIVCVLGHQSENVLAAVEKRFGKGSITVALQKEQRGTGHAVAQAKNALRGFDGPVLILYGDTPLLTDDTIKRLLDAGKKKTLALVTTRLSQPRGYGRILRDGAGHLVRIVEERDASDAERAITEINAGLYCVQARFLFDALGKLRSNNAQGELYLTDVAERAAREGEVATVEADAAELAGVNDRVELSRADRAMRVRINEELMRSGVTMRAPETILVEPGVTVGADSEIGPGVELRGGTKIGANVKIDAGCILTDAAIADGAHLKPYTVIAESSVGEASVLGPFAHLRPGSAIGAHAKIGNFVETKKARFGDGAKASHLSYLGDAVIGAGANIGCGTITCNYDGYNKFETVIGEDAFIGSDTQLVAPVTVGKRAVVAAGTTVVEDVPAGALSLSRTQQLNIPGYYEKKARQRAEKAKAASKGKKVAARRARR
jgi:bifunctional UDP-N-acetylglucosamine pyrophosphorylase/glucosamine-1-phosphate N-acetyltransferase